MKGRRFNWVLSDWLRTLGRHWLQWSARLRGQRFYCAALAGVSEYNITINCDLTLSCACQDYDGSGHLGDLNRNSFREVFFGPVAQRFREQLAKGKLPIRTCTRCADLRRVPKSNVRREAVPAADGGQGAPVLVSGPTPRLPYRGLLLENTVRCNLDCLGCDRQSAARIRSTPQMDLEKITRMADLASELQLQQLFYLNLGEPFLSRHIGEELRILRQKNPKCRIVISTNGIVLSTDAQREAALSASHIFFSVAGINNEMLYKYERSRSFDKAYANMKALADYRNARGLSRPLLEWKYLLFNWNDHPQTIQQAIDLAKAAGLDAISFWPTGNPFYGISWRYRLGWLDHIGTKSWKGREVALQPNYPSTGASPPAPSAPLQDADAKVPA